MNTTQVLQPSGVVEEQGETVTFSRANQFLQMLESFFAAPASGDRIVTSYDISDGFARFDFEFMNGSARTSLMQPIERFLERSTDADYLHEVAGNVVADLARKRFLRSESSRRVRR